MSEELLSVDANVAAPPASVYGDEHHRKGSAATVIKKTSAPVDFEIVAKDLNSKLRMLDTKVAFAVDRSANKVIIRVVNADTDEVIRQIPPEEMLHIAARIKELLGVIFDGTA